MTEAGSVEHAKNMRLRSDIREPTARVGASVSPVSRRGFDVAGEPRFVSPWAKWKEYGRIKLSHDRGRTEDLSDIAVYDELPESVFVSPEPVALKEGRHEGR